MTRLRSLAWSLLVLALGASTAGAGASPWDRAMSPGRTGRALRGVLGAVYRAARRGERPLVVVDIDDTAIDGRARLRRAAARAGLPSAHLTSADDLFAGVPAPVLEARRSTFNRHYFGDAALAELDVAQAGAPRFLRAVERAGGTVVYVSGRWESTRASTMALLRSRGLPLADPANLVLNPSETVTASDWKRAVRGRIAGLGRPIAFFDNEAEAIASYREAFPRARGFRLATFRFRAAPPTLPRGVRVVRDFAFGRRRDERP